MDLEKWYRRGGFAVGGAVAASFFALIYLWLAGVHLLILNVVFQVLLLVFLFWAALSPIAVRSWRKHARVGFVIGSVVFILPALLFGNSFLQLFIPSWVLLKALNSTSNWHLLVLSGLYVLLIAAAGRYAVLGIVEHPKFANRSIVVLGSLLTLLLVPEMIAIGVVDQTYRNWYKILLQIRGDYLPYFPQIAVLNIDNEQMPEKKLGDLLEILVKSNPAVIGLASNTTSVTFADSLKRRKGIDLVSGNLSADGGVRWGREGEVPLYYWPAREKRGELALNMVRAHEKKENRDDRIELDEDKVRVGSREIPLLGNGRVLINYHRDSEHGFYRPAFADYYYYELHDGETVSNLIWGIGRGASSYVRVNFEAKTLEAPTGKEVIVKDYSGTRKKRGFEPAKLSQVQDRIFLINVEQRSDWRPSFFSTGLVYASIIQNILDGDYLKEPRGWVLIIVTLLIVGLIAWAFMRFNVYRAFVGVIAGTCLAGGILVLVFLFSETLINPYPIIVPLAGTILFMLPIGISADRRILFQEQSRLQAELNTAHDMQMGLMPVADPVVKGYDVSGLCVPANEVGGDFFDYVWLDRKQTKFGIALADVSGKAMKAAMTAVMTSGMIYRELGSNGTPKTILRRINKPMYAKLDQRMFTAMSLASIDLRTKELTLSNAGQVHPLMLRGGQVQRLKVQGERLPLGVMEEVRYEELKFKLKKNDTIVFFTDGVVEAMNEQRELYEMERLEQELLRAGGFTAKALREHIIASVGQFTGKALQHDDITVVVVRVL